MNGADKRIECDFERLTAKQVGKAIQVACVDGTFVLIYESKDFELDSGQVISFQEIVKLPINIRAIVEILSK